MDEERIKLGELKNRLGFEQMPNAYQIIPNA